MRRFLAVMLPFVLLGAALQSCGDDRGAIDQPAATVPPQATDRPAVTAADTGTGNAPEALQFTAPMVDGSRLDFRSLAGTTVALWFWAPT
jgi:hypothetical protein